MSAAAEALLQGLVHRILSIELSHPTRVCVDGHSTAGKSTMCAALEPLLGAAGRQCVRVELDDFHPENYLSHASRFGTVEEYLGGGYEWDVIVGEVLVPAGPAGNRRVRRRFWDSFQDQPFDPGWTVLDHDAVLLVDGVFAQLPWLRPHWDLTVWLDVDFSTVLQRAEIRDLAWGGGTAEGVRRAYEERWLPRHRHYQQSYRPAEVSDIVIDNRNPTKPFLLRG